MSKVRFLISFFLLANALVPSSHAKPRDRYDCECIAVLEYRGPSDPYNRDFRPVEILKGIPCGNYISIKRKASMKFDKGSLWIVFITYAAPVHGLYEPYEGTDGIEKFSPDNFEEVLSGLERRRHIKYDRDKAQKLFQQLEAHRQTRGMLDSDLLN